MTEKEKLQSYYCGRDACCRNSESDYLPTSCCDKVLCPNRIPKYPEPPLEYADKPKYKVEFEAQGISDDMTETSLRMNLRACHRLYFREKGIKIQKLKLIKLK